MATPANERRTEVAPLAASRAVGGERRKEGARVRNCEHPSRERAGVWAEKMGEGLKTEMCARARDGLEVSGSQARFAAARARTVLAAHPTPSTFSARSASKKREADGEARE